MPAIIAKASSQNSPAECDSAKRIPHSPFPNPSSPRRCSLFSAQRSSFSAAFTLVELLIVIAIMAILASLMLFALAGAQQTAYEMRTRGTITKLNDIIMQKYESYRTRRLPVDLTAIAASRSYSANPLGWARARVDTIRELMRLEMPERITDVMDIPENLPASQHCLTATPSSCATFINVIYGSLPMAHPASDNTLSKKIIAISNFYGGKSPPFEHAKFLYLIVKYASGDPDVMEQFATYEVAQDPTDNLNYFVDGWKNPIHILRWAPAYYSPMQPDPSTGTPQHDQFDPLKSYPAATNVALFPLIYSNGQDGLDETQVGGTALHYATVNNDPYYSLSTSSPIGGWSDDNNDGVDGRTDNISNHDIETR